MVSQFSTYAQKLPNGTTELIKTDKT